MDQKYFLISYNGCIHFPMLGLKLLYVSKINPLNWRHVICKCILRRFVSSFKVDCVFSASPVDNNSTLIYAMDLQKDIKSHFINPHICMCVTMARCDKIWTKSYCNHLQILIDRSDYCASTGWWFHLMKKYQVSFFVIARSLFLKWACGRNNC